MQGGWCYSLWVFVCFDFFSTSLPPLILKTFKLLFSENKKTQKSAICEGCKLKYSAGREKFQLLLILDFLTPRTDEIIMCKLCTVLISKVY